MQFQLKKQKKNKKQKQTKRFTNVIRIMWGKKGKQRNVKTKGLTN